MFQQKNNLTTSEYAQEYEFDFEVNVLLDSVYGEFIDRYTVNNIGSEYCWDPHEQVYVSWDLGYRDAAALWFFQKKGNLLTFIDYYENNGHEVEFFADFLSNRRFSPLGRINILTSKGNASITLLETVFPEKPRT